MDQAVLDDALLKLCTRRRGLSEEPGARLDEGVKRSLSRIERFSKPARGSPRLCRSEGLARRWRERFSKGPIRSYSVAAGSTCR
jgi:hypothetical protein